MLVSTLGEFNFVQLNSCDKFVMGEFCTQSSSFNEVIISTIAGYISIVCLQLSLLSYDFSTKETRKLALCSVLR